jgi:hypothetical protein
MSLNQERQAKLIPIRVEEAKEEITKLGFEITYENDKRIEFIFKDEKVMFYPYSGWFTGKSVQDGRGLQNLLIQIKP